MSAHVPCSCGRKAGDLEGLVVLARRGNNSAFNGYRWQPSAYSQVVCVRKGCCGNWRTRAAYVDKLPDRTAEQAYGGGR